MLIFTLEDLAQQLVSVPGIVKEDRVFRILNHGIVRDSQLNLCASEEK